MIHQQTYDHTYYFFDDLLENLESAKERGWITIWISPNYKEAYKHKGSSFVEVYQNCNIFNDGAFSELTERESANAKASLNATPAPHKPLNG